MITCKIKNEKKRYEFLSGYFEREFSWDIQGVTEDGLLVQRIDRVFQTNSPSYNTKHWKYNHHYYEYWEIINGTIEKEKGCNYDDRWNYGVIFENNLICMLRDCLDKYGIAGETKMKGTIFFVPNTHNRYNDIVHTFTKEIEYAGNLPSKKDICYENELHMIFTHEYKHGWDFSMEVSFFDAISEIAEFCGLKELSDDYNGNPIYSKLGSFLFS